MYWQADGCTVFINAVQPVLPRFSCSTCITVLQDVYGNLSLHLRAIHVRRQVFASVACRRCSAPWKRCFIKSTFLLRSFLVTPQIFLKTDISKTQFPRLLLFRDPRFRIIQDDRLNASLIQTNHRCTADIIRFSRHPSQQTKPGYPFEVGLSQRNNRRLGPGLVALKLKKHQQTGTLKTRDWKTRDLKSMESVTIFKSKSYGAQRSRQFTAAW